MPVPGFRMGNSSSTIVAAFIELGFLMGNSSSSGAPCIGIGADMVPRIDLRPGLARPGPAFHKLGIACVECGPLADYGRSKSDRRKRGNNGDTAARLSQSIWDNRCVEGGWGRNAESIAWYPAAHDV